MAKNDFKKNKAYNALPDGFKALVKDIKSDSLPNILLICGKEQLLVNWSVNEIIKKNVNETTRALDLVRIDSNRTSVSAISEACDTISLFSTKKVVLLEDFYPAESKTKKKKEKGESSAAEYTDSEVDDHIDWKDFISYMPQISEGTLLVMVCDIPDADSEMFKAIQNNGKVYVIKTLQGADLRSFIEKRIKNAGKSIRPNVLREFIDITGYNDKDSDYNLYNLENDIHKVLAHSRGAEITSEDVNAGVIGNLDHDMFALLDAVSQGRKDEAYRLFFNEMRNQDSVLPLLSQIIIQFERILFVREMRDESKNLDEMCRLLKQKPGDFKIKKAYSFSEYYTAKKLKQILKHAYEVDLQIKLGLLSESLALEMFISQL